MSTSIASTINPSQRPNPTTPSRELINGPEHKDSPSENNKGLRIAFMSFFNSPFTSGVPDMKSISDWQANNQWFVNHEKRGAKCGSHGAKADDEMPAY
ncbi:hypothetical protein AFLA_011804 [Aspergillus flavus NRRL3357]|nr:hypothetical protein AFLA_011804 [Aspergillus flavus NRRL3357]